MTGTTAALILLAHMVGDYVVQSDWMALEKTKPTAYGVMVALVHALTYGACFLVVTTDVWALFAIVVTHWAVDHLRLARYLCWAKNQLAPRAYRYPLSAPHWFGHEADPDDERAAKARFADTTGYERHREPWMTAWLMIAADNTVHLAIAVAAVLAWGTS